MKNFNKVISSINKINRKYLSLSGIVLVIIVVLITVNNKKLQEVSTITDNEKQTIQTVKSNREQETGKSEDLNNYISNELMEADDEFNTLQNPDEISDKTIIELDELVNKYYVSSNGIDKELLAGNSEKEIDKALETIIKKREGIEGYNNIKSIVRHGRQKDSFIIFSTYNMKFYNIETLAPGMSVLYVIKNDKGAFEIFNEPNGDQLKEYIIQLSKEKEIKDIIKSTNLNLTAAIEKDDTLKAFVGKLEGIAN